MVIPRIGVAGSRETPMPFMRAYSPALRSFGIAEEDFLTFIDHLAVAEAAPAPLQALGVVGQAFGVM